MARITKHLVVGMLGVILTGIGWSFILAQDAGAEDGRSEPVSTTRLATTVPTTTPAASQPAAALQAWYTTDDGQTWFADDAAKVAPFEFNGKEAVRCHVFRSAQGRPFVGYLERWDPEAHDRIRAARAKGALTDELIQELSPRHKQLKRPGDREWIRAGEAENARRITTIVGPDGKAPEEIFPSTLPPSSGDNRDVW